MQLSILRRLLAVFALLVLLPVAGYAQEAVLSGTVTDSTGGVLPGVTVTATHTATGNTFVAVTDAKGGYRLPVRVGVQGRCGASGLRHGDTSDRSPHRPDRGAQSSDGPVDGAGVGDRHRRSAARRHDEFEPGGQRRSAADAGPAGQRPQLDGPHAACAGQPRELGGRDADRLDELEHHVPAQSRRPAGHQPGRPELRPAALQPRRDRRVRVRVEPLRRVAGALERHPGERDHQVRHEHAGRHVLGLLPQREVQREGSRGRRGAAVPGPADQHDLRRADHQGSHPLLPELRVRARAADLRLQHAVSEVQRQADRRAPPGHRDGALRLPVLAAEAPVGARQPLRQPDPVRLALHRRLGQDAGVGASAPTAGRSRSSATSRRCSARGWSTRSRAATRCSTGTSSRT